MSRGNTIEGRLDADEKWPFARVGWNPNGCCAILKLGVVWARFNRHVFCSRRRLPDNAFCGQHDHLNLFFGEDAEAYLKRALKRAHGRGQGLSFPERSSQDSQP